mgnify:CR=1 FL=1
MEVKFKHTGTIFTGDPECPAYANVFFYEERYNLKTWEKIPCPITYAEDSVMDESGTSYVSSYGINDDDLNEIIEERRLYYENMLLNGKG